VQLGRAREESADIGRIQAQFDAYKQTHTCENRDATFRHHRGFSSFKEFEDLSAVLYYPYTVSLMSAFEIYGMNIPIFTPGLETAVALDMRGKRMWKRARDFPVSPNKTAPWPPSPQDHSYEATRFWAQQV
jgi:hypothetical protein